MAWVKHSTAWSMTALLIRSGMHRGTGRLQSVEGLPSTMPHNMAELPHGIDFSLSFKHASVGSDLDVEEGPVVPGFGPAWSRLSGILQAAQHLCNGVLPQLLHQRMFWNYLLRNLFGYIVVIMFQIYHICLITLARTHRPLEQRKVCSM